MDPDNAPSLAITGSASPAQTAAITAAIASFTDDTASPRPGAERAGSGPNDAWTRAAMLEGVARAGQAIEGGVLDPWINT